jgi:phage major head subunit gpT-like protein
MIINADSLAALTTGFKSAFKQGFENKNFNWSQVATMIQSNTLDEDYAFLGQFPTMREWIGDRVLKNMEQYSYTLRNKDYEATVEVSRNKIEDDQYGVYTPIFQSAGYAAAEHTERLVFDAIKNATTSVCYDGQFFLDTDHQVGETTESNYGGGSGALWMLLDNSRPLKPIIYQERKAVQLVSKVNMTDESVFMRKAFLYGIDGRMAAGYGLWQLAYGSKQTLDADAFNAAYSSMASRVNDEGRPLGIIPTHLVVTPSNRAAAQAILEAQFGPNGASNTNFGAVKLIVSPYMI